MIGHVISCLKQKGIATHTVASSPNMLPKVFKFILSNRFHQKINCTLGQTLKDYTHRIMG